jgi:hypothetical protein
VRSALRALAPALAILFVTACSSNPAPTVAPHPGDIELACDDPYPGHCLGPIAWAVSNLPAGDRSVISITDTAMPFPCATGPTCLPPPHRGDEWVVFRFEDGRTVSMWVAEVMAHRNVQAVGADLVPSRSPDPATVRYPLHCGAIDVQTCVSVAAGGVVSNTTPSSVSVAAAQTPGTYTVDFVYIDGTNGTVEVARNPDGAFGWAPFRSQPPPPSAPAPTFYGVFPAADATLGPNQPVLPDIALHDLAHVWDSLGLSCVSHTSGGPESPGNFTVHCEGTDAARTVDVVADADYWTREGILDIGVNVSPSGDGSIDATDAAIEWITPFAALAGGDPVVGWVMSHIEDPSCRLDCTEIVKRSTLSYSSGVRGSQQLFYIAGTKL